MESLPRMSYSERCYKCGAVQQISLPRTSDFIGGPSDLNDIACDLLRKRPVPEGRRHWLALQVLEHMMRREAALLGGDPPIVPVHDLESFTDKPVGWWKP